MIDQKFSKGVYTLKKDIAAEDIEALMGLLAQTYWAKDRTREVVEKSVKGSLCYGVYHQGVLMGFLRLVTDGAVFAYLCDVIVDEGHRGQGLSKWMLAEVLGSDELRGLRRICLMTQDAQELYRRFGFNYLSEPKRYMEIINTGGQQC